MYLLTIKCPICPLVSLRCSVCLKLKTNSSATCRSQWKQENSHWSHWSCRLTNSPVTKTQQVCCDPGVMVGFIRVGGSPKRQTLLEIVTKRQGQRGVGWAEEEWAWAGQGLLGSCMWPQEARQDSMEPVTQDIHSASNPAFLLTFGNYIRQYSPLHSSGSWKTAEHWEEWSFNEFQAIRQDLSMIIQGSRRLPLHFD